jgi:C4-dicarboxylate-specific signal transduction histidine kinase
MTPLVMADPVQLQQVILNLVMNAVEPRWAWNTHPEAAD